jgi:hypothetical protein
MKTPYRQQGLSTISWLIVILVAAFFITSAVKLLPVYMQAMTVDSTIQKVVDSGELQGKSAMFIRKKLGKLLNVNQVEAIKLKDIKIVRDEGYTTIDARYEQRTPLMYNIDVVLKFEEHIYEFPTTSKED